MIVPNSSSSRISDMFSLLLSLYLNLGYDLLFFTSHLVNVPSHFLQSFTDDYAYDSIYFGVNTKIALL